MQRFRFPIAVAVTLLALLAILIGAGGLIVGNALANSPFAAAVGGAGPWNGGPWAAGHNGWQTNSLPPELVGLSEIPAGERFAHLRGVRLRLTDKDNKPLTVDVTPGTATAVSPTSLTVTANDGSTHTFTLDDKTIIHAKSNGRDAAQTATSSLNATDKVIVATLNNATTATAVLAVNPDGFGPRGPFGH